MAHQTYSDCRIIVHDTDLTGYSNTLGLTYGCAVHDGTTFRKGTRVKAPGQKNVAAEGGGYWITGASDAMPDDAIQPMVGVVDRYVLLCTGLGTGGEIGFAFKAIKGSYKFGAAVDELLPFSVSLEGSGQILRGPWLGALELTGAAAAQTTGVQHVAVAANQTLYGVLHCHAFVGFATLDVKVQSAATQGGAYADRITCAQLAAVGHEWATDASEDSDTWYRLDYTLVGAGSSCKFEVLVAVLND